MRSISSLVTVILLCIPITAGAEMIVTSPGTALYDSDVDGFMLKTVSAPVDSNGLTMNVTFTPNATDATNSVGNAISLIEIGGNVNGSGLYLYNMEVYFLGKMNSAAGTTQVPTSMPDTDYNPSGTGGGTVGVKSSFGPLSALTTYTAAVIYDPLGDADFTLLVKPSGGSITQDDFALSNTTGRTDWSGNNTVTALIAPTNMGGGTTADTVFQETAVNGDPFNGVKGQALLWEGLGTVVPEPSTLCLAALGLLGLRRRRRR